MSQRTIFDGRSKRPAVTVATFNENSRSLCLGLENEGFRIITINAVDTVDVIYDSTLNAKESHQNLTIVERLFESSLVAVVNRIEPRKLRLVHFRKEHEICTYSYSSNILAVRLNRARLIVCLSGSILIHNVRDMRVLHTIQEMPANACGLIALSSQTEIVTVPVSPPTFGQVSATTPDSPAPAPPKETREEVPSYLAYPCHEAIGEVQIFDTLNMAAAVTIPAHSSRLAALTFSRSGHLIATASEKGTVLRVFDLSLASKQGVQLRATRLYEFRRGLARTAAISSLAFADCSTYLVASSNTETVHVFHLTTCIEEPLSAEQRAALAGEDPPSWVSSCLSSVVEAASSSVTTILPPFLPTHISNAIFVQDRACCVAYINDSNTSPTAPITRSASTDDNPTAVDQLYSSTSMVADAAAAAAASIASPIASYITGDTGVSPGHICTLATISDVLRLVVVSLVRAELSIYTVPSSGAGGGYSADARSSSSLPQCQLLHTFDLVGICDAFSERRRADDQEKRRSPTYAEQARTGVQTPAATGEGEKFYELAAAVSVVNDVATIDENKFPPMSTTLHRAGS